jgi:L-fuconolactonase
MINPLLQAAPSHMPVIDTHIHLFDPARPGGVPWPEPSNAALYTQALPPRYEKLAQPRGVVGAIAIECSPWMIDNLWLQDVVEKNPTMLGYIGDLDPADAAFAATLDWLHRSPLLLGIRYGNLWNRDLLASIQTPAFVAGLKLLAQAGLVLETANPNTALLGAALEVCDRVPDLRIVMDHLPHADLPAAPSARAEYDKHLRELARNPNVFAKGSEIPTKVKGSVALDPGIYKANLDALWDLFGEDRMLFGSDWPNSDSIATYDETFRLAQGYIATRTLAAQQKYFWKNSIAVYRWKPRISAQKKLLSS